ncbi:MAG: type II secretion system protein [Phycisphaerae bacterium]|nr:type II secretion system protein [Phycisphaerae bacterium]
MSGRQSKLSVTATGKGFTLLELLVTVGIIAALIAILSVSVSKVRNAGRTVMCMNNLKTVSQEFFRFADDSTRTYRGDSERTGRLFRIEDFQEKLYRVHEFWDGGDSKEIAIDQSTLPLACPAASGILTKRRSLPCSESAVVPLENISTAFNMRLDRVSTVVRGWPLLQRTRLTTRILEHPDVPLAFGADGAEAARNGVIPYYSTPSAGDTGLYGTGKFWFPSLRHEGKLNVAFIGGYVLRTADPGSSPKSNWKYQPPLQ